MQRKVFMAALVTAIACICGCGSHKDPMPELSSEYYCGTYYGGCGYGTFYDCFSGEVIVCTNKDLLVYMPKDDSREYILAETLKLTDVQYDGIVSSINREELYYLDPKEQIEICDGDSSYIKLYDENNELLKNCGGYMPANQSFLNMQKSLYNYLPMAELNKIRNDWANKLMEVLSFCSAPSSLT